MLTILFRFPDAGIAPPPISPGDVFTEPRRGLTFRESARGLVFLEPNRGLTFNVRRGTMPIQTLVKRPGETRVYVYDYANFPEIDGGDSLSGSPTVNIVTGDDELTAGSPSRSGDTVEVAYSDGTSGVEYLTEMLCNTNSGAVLACVGKVKVTRFGDK